MGRGCRGREGGRVEGREGEREERRSEREGERERERENELGMSLGKALACGANPLLSPAWASDKCMKYEQDQGSALGRCFLLKFVVLFFFCGVLG